MGENEVNSAPFEVPVGDVLSGFHLWVTPDSFLTIRGWDKDRPPAGFQIHPRMILVNRNTGERIEITNSETDDWLLYALQLDSV